MADLYAAPSSQFDVQISGAPSGLATMGVRILQAPEGTEVVARSLAAEVVPGSGVYSATLTAPTDGGDYIVFWDDGTVSPTTTATDLLHVTQSGYPPTPPTSTGPDLVTLDEVKAALDVDPTDTRKDALYAAMIPWASKVVRNYTGREFGAPLVTERRAFEYDGSGFLDIDDASDITEVRFIVPNAPDIVLDPQSWYAAPPRRADAPVFYYVVFTTIGGINPYMGFERNLDVAYEEGRLPSVTRTAQVTGTWGWPDVPGDVKLATVWTIIDWTSKPSGENLTSEAIEGYSRAWGSKTSGATALAIPNRARDILANYQKLYA